MTKGIQLEINELLELRYYVNKVKSIKNKRRSNSPQFGEKASYARGRGMDFAEVRRYQGGDDIRLIHWPLTARLGKTFTKVYHEERERMVYLLIDQSFSMKFGTRVAFKNIIAAKVASLLGWSFLSQQEQVGGVIFNDSGLAYIKPKRTYQSLFDMFNILISNKVKQYQGGLNNTLKFMLGNIHSGSSVVVISDYNNLNEETENYLKIIASKCELVNILIYDPLEESFPDLGTFSFTNEGKNILEISATKHNKEQYKMHFVKRLEQLKTLSKQNKVRLITIATNDDIIDKIKHGILDYGN